MGHVYLPALSGEPHDAQHDLPVLLVPVDEESMQGLPDVPMLTTADREPEALVGIALVPDLRAVEVPPIRRRMSIAWGLWLNTALPPLVAPSSWGMRGRDMNSW